MVPNFRFVYHVTKTNFRDSPTNRKLWKTKYFFHKNYKFRDLLVLNRAWQNLLSCSMMYISNYFIHQFHKWLIYQCIHYRSLSIWSIFVTNCRSQCKLGSVLKKFWCIDNLSIIPVVYTTNMCQQKLFFGNNMLDV